MVWDYPKCIHSEHCWRELGTVFRRNEKPWINLDGAETEAIIEQIDKCPSGALSYRMEGESSEGSDLPKIIVAKDGPLLVQGDCILTLPDGSVDERKGKTALCRCGASSAKPFCDGSHSKINFKG